MQAESGLRGHYTRADAVSSLAEVRVRVERASRRAPWRVATSAEAREKLDAADHQIRQNHYAAAVFFVERARRMADQLLAEADQLRTRAASYVRGAHVNLRLAPSTDESVIAVLTAGTPVFVESRKPGWALVRTTSGSVGWVHLSLLERPDEGTPANLAD